MPTWSSSAGIEEGQLGNRLKHVRPEVRGRVGILRPLSEPLLADKSLRPARSVRTSTASAPPLGAGDHEERQEHIPAHRTRPSRRATRSSVRATRPTPVIRVPRLEVEAFEPRVGEPRVATSATRRPPARMPIRVAIARPGRDRAP